MSCKPCQPRRCNDFDGLDKLQQLLKQKDAESTYILNNLQRIERIKALNNLSSSNITTTESKVEVDDHKSSESVTLNKIDGKLTADLKLDSNSLLKIQNGLTIDKEALEAYLELLIENQYRSEMRDVFGDPIELRLEKE